MNAQLILDLCEAFDRWDGDGDGLEVIAAVPDATIEELEAHRAIIEAEHAIATVRHTCADAVFRVLADAMVFEDLNVGQALATLPDALAKRLLPLVVAVSELDRFDTEVQ